MNYSKPYHISVVYVFILLIGSVVFYRERIFFCDSTFVLFEMINNYTFIISEHRYGAFITQLLPLIGVQLSAPINVILLLYSISFYLFFLFIIVFSGHVLKQKLYSILFAFYLCFIVTDVYFWTNNEIHQSAGWMILFLSLFNYIDIKKWKTNGFIHIGLVSTLFFTILSHILIVIPLAYLWIYNFLNIKKSIKQLKYFAFYSCLILFFVGLRYYLSYDSSYDGTKLEGVKQMSTKSIFYAIANDQSISFSKLLINKYWTFLLVSGAGIITLIYKKKVYLTILTISFIAAYFLLVVLTHSAAITEFNLFYFESQWMCISLIACYPFLSETMKLNKIHKIILVSFILIYLLKLQQIHNSLPKFQLRLSNLETLVDTAKAKKLEKSYVFKSQDLNKSLFNTWALPVETALLSSTRKPKEFITIKTFSKEAKISTTKDSIYTAYQILHHSWVNPNYFKFSNNSMYTPLYETNDMD